MIQFDFTNGGKNLIAKIIIFADIHKLKYTDVNKILTKVYNFTIKLAKSGSASQENDTLEDSVWV